MTLRCITTIKSPKWSQWQNKPSQDHNEPFGSFLELFNTCDDLQDQHTELCELTAAGRATWVPNTDARKMCTSLFFNDFKSPNKLWVPANAS